jgi:hypothetical protein
MNLWSFNYAAALAFEARSQDGDWDGVRWLKASLLPGMWVRSLVRENQSNRRSGPSHLTENRLRVVGCWPRIQWLKGEVFPVACKSEMFEKWLGYLGIVWFWKLGVFWYQIFDCSCTVPDIFIFFFWGTVQMTSFSRLLREGSSFKAVVVVARLIHGSRVASLGPLYSVRLSLFQSGELGDFSDRKRGFISWGLSHFQDNLVFESGNNAEAIHDSVCLYQTDVVGGRPMTGWYIMDTLLTLSISAVTWGQDHHTVHTQLSWSSGPWDRRWCTLSVDRREFGYFTGDPLVIVGQIAIRVQNRMGSLRFIPAFNVPIPVEVSLKLNESGTEGYRTRGSGAKRGVFDFDLVPPYPGSESAV